MVCLVLFMRTPTHNVRHTMHTVSHTMNTVNTVHTVHPSMNFDKIKASISTD